MSKNIHKVKKCARTNKTKFSTEKVAGKVMMRIWSHDPSADILDLHTYLCEYCGRWHVGHKSYYEKKLANERIQQNFSAPAN